MSNLNLIQKFRCLNKKSDSNFSLKDSLTKIKDAIFESLSTLAKDVGSSIGDQLKQIKSPSEIYDETVEKAKIAYSNTKETLDGYKKQLSDMFDTNCPPDDTPANQPTTNVTLELVSLPKTQETLSPITKNIQNLDKASTTSLKNVNNAIININKDLSKQGILETRETVRLLSNKHPLLDESVKKLSYFQPISESICENYLGYNPDKPSVSLSDWETGVCKTIRKSIFYKLGQDHATNVEKHYTELNRRLASNISNEFFQERKLPLLNFAHAYHLAGDIQWVMDHMKKDNLPIKISDILNIQLGDQIGMINYLTPMMPKTIISDNIYQEQVEDVVVNIDKRKNIVRNPFEKVNNDCLKPEKV